MLSIFSCVCCLFVYLLLRNVYFDLPKFFSGLFGFLFFVCFLSCMSCWYNLEIKPLLAALFANIFCLQALLAFSFAVQKLISLIRSYLFLLLFLLPWETDLRKPWYCFWQRMFCLFSLSEILWCHVLLIYNFIFWVIFVYAMRACSHLIYLWLSSFPNTTCWRDFFSLYSLASFIKD